jgi:hypothetical protein
MAWILVAAAATLADAHPGSGIVVDGRGNAYFVDTGGGVWRADSGGTLAHVGDPRFHWIAMDDGERPPGSRLPSIPGEIEAIGSKPTLLVSSDVPIAIGSDGTLYYPELGRDQRLRLMKVSRSGVRAALAVLPSATQEAGAPLRWINGLAAGPDGSLHYTEDRAVRRADRRGVVTTLAENLSVPDCAAIPGTEGSAPYLRGLAVAADGKVLVAASGCGAVLEVSPRGEVRPVLRTSPPWSPTAVATSPSGVYVLEYLHTTAEDRQAWVPRVRKILANGTIVDVGAVQRTTAR